MALSVDDIVAVLADGAGTVVEGTAHTHLEHALQVGSLLMAAYPDDHELAVAGLVHDIGHLLPGVSDAEHAAAGSKAVASALGTRVAEVVGLHVEAKRYLVAVEGGYALAADSVASLREQGGAMGLLERAAFEALAAAGDAVRLRRADEGGKSRGVDAGGLDRWHPVLLGVHQRHG